MRPGQRRRRPAGRRRPAERDRAGHRDRPRDRLSRRRDGDLRRHQDRPADRRRADRHDRLRPDRHGDDATAPPTSIAMTDGAVRPAAARAGTRRGQVQRRAGGHRRRVARVPRRRRAVHRRSGPDPTRAWSGTPARRLRRCWRAGRRWWPPPSRGRPARCRPGSSGPAWAPTTRPPRCCAGCCDQDVPVLVDADGLTLLASRHALLGRRRRRVARPCSPRTPGVRPGVPGHRPRRPAGRRPPRGRRRPARPCCSRGTAPIVAAPDGRRR